MKGIYKIQNTITGKVYIGQSVDMWDRITKHIKKLKSNTHDNRFIQEDWNLYGESSFKFEVEICLVSNETVLESIQKDVLFYYEAETMKKYSNKYNIH